VPHARTAYFYAMSGILGELYSFNIGVGYTLPFELFAARWIDAEGLTDRLNNLQLPGVKFLPIHYKPYYGAQQGEYLHGVRTYITDTETAPLTMIQFYVMQECRRLHPDMNVFELCDPSRLNMFDKVCGTRQVREAFAENFTVSSIEPIWNRGVDQFKERAKHYYMYQ
jgi:uncharacterized protein YbbC (DUF1343 family)